MLGSGSIKVNKRGKNSCPYRAHILVADTENK